MEKKVLNFTDLVQRVTASCLLHPLGSSRFLEAQMTPDRFSNNKQFKPKPKLKDEIEDADDNDEHEFDDSSSIKEEEDQESGEIYEDAIGREIEDIEKYKYSGRGGSGIGPGGSGGGGGGGNGRFGSGDSSFSNDSGNGGCNNVLYLRGVPEDEEMEDADRD